MNFREPLFSVRSIVVEPLSFSNVLYMLSRLTASREGRFFLVSLNQRDFFGRFSIFAADPIVTCLYQRGTLFVSDSLGKSLGRKSMSFAESLEYITAPLPGSEQRPAPFSGVAVGFFAYDACKYLERVTLPRQVLFDLPDFVFFFSDTFIVRDHFEQETYLVLLDTNRSTLSIEERRRAFHDEIAHLETPHLFVPFTEEKVTAQPLVSKEDYLRAIRRIIAYIHAGDVYQVNYAYPIRLRTSAATADLFMQYVLKNPVDFAAYGSYGGVEVLSLSPECFFTLYGDTIKSYPIKGTIGRAGDPERDLALRKQLLSSEKDLAELAMIVDVVRNDMGKVARVGSVKVKQHASLDTFQTLYHLFSVVQGTVDSSRRGEIIASLFPGASVTGAPKVRAMEIIAELEPYRRGIYTGSIGWIGYHRGMAFNIAIRTIQKRKDELYYFTGGGIVADSDPLVEYEETIVKTRSFFNIFPEVDLVVS